MLRISSTSLNKPVTDTSPSGANFASITALMAVGRGLTVLQLDEVELHNGGAPFFTPRFLDVPRARFGTSSPRAILCR